MLVATIIDNEIGTRWDIIKEAEDMYAVEYSEYYTACGWRKLFREHEYYSKDAIEYDFDIVVE